MKTKLHNWVFYSLAVLLFLLFLYALKSLIAYGLFGSIAAIGQLCSGEEDEAAETILQVAFCTSSAACVLPGTYSLFKWLAGEHHAMPVALPLAVAAVVMQIGVLVAAATWPDEPYMAVAIPCFILLGLLMLASYWWKRRKAPRRKKR